MVKILKVVLTRDFNLGFFTNSFNFKVQERGVDMNKIYKIAVSSILMAVLVGISGCSGMSTCQKSTAIGAGVGAAAGAVVTGGGIMGTVGGAAIGGVIGNQIGKDKK
ncbi:MAG: glycine zipper 2TM domain-containing protein [Methylococcaceae bacterium]|nr:glycine zipper 2TM domain-containing protein [Methylococcaceae bacterium]